MNKIDRLKKEIAQNLALLDKLQSQEKLTIRLLSEYTPEEKVEKFNELYIFAESCLSDMIKSGNGDDDDEHFAWEAVMGLLAKDRSKFWSYWNSLSE